MAKQVTWKNESEGETGYGNKGGKEKPKSVKGKDGYYYLTDNNGQVTDKLDTEYYEAQPAFKAYMQQAGIKSFNSVNDVKDFEKFQANLSAADVAQMEKEAKEPVFKDLNTGGAEKYGLTDAQALKIGKKLDKKMVKTGGELKMKNIKQIAKKMDLSFDAVLNHAKDLHISGDVNFGDKMLDKIEGNVGKYGDMGTDYITSGKGDSVNKIIKDAVGEDGWDKMYKGANFEKGKDAINEAYESGQFDPRQPTDAELFKRMDVPKETQKKMDKFEDKYGDRIGDKSGKLLKDADGNKIKIKAPDPDKKYGKKKLNKAKLKMQEFMDKGGFQVKNVTASKASSLKSKGSSLISGLGI